MRVRLALLLALLLLGSCALVPDQALIPVPPEKVGTWIRRGLETPDPATAPDSVHDLHPLSWVRAAYYRDGTLIEASAYGFRAETSALEARQRWQPEEQAAVFLRGPVFVVCTSRGPQPGAPEEFARQLEMAWFNSPR